jgi:hypothetical protein
VQPLGKEDGVAMQVGRERVVDAFRQVRLHRRTPGSVRRNASARTGHGAQKAAAGSMD